jgi:hypothetical protein
MKQVSTLVTVLLAAALLAGCAAGKAPSAAEKAAATAEKAAATAQKAAELVVATKAAPIVERATETPAKPAAPAAKATVVPPTATSAPAAEDALSVQSRAGGLDKLKSYRSQWRGEWKATESGETQSTTWDWFEEISTADNAHHWGSKMTDAKSAKPVTFEFWQIGDASYIMTTDEQGKQECMAFSGEANSAGKGLLTPGALGGVSGAKYAGTETVNGIRTKHYKYDEKAATLAGFGKASGDIWVAEDGGYVVKDTLNWEGAAGLFGAGTKGSGAGTWTYQLQDVNKPLVIKPPEICEKGKVDVPTMPDATEKSVMGPLLSYKTAAKPKDVVEFYSNAMAKAGWQQEGEPEVAAELSTVSFAKDGATVQITIMPADGKTQVLVTTSKE